ncbi:hypothetical protein PVAND_007643 [Polypedilum vanderplanki]|uniref:Serine palmitoyltransferase small subunit A n=1 Tax=Polypedilum vanderplanki TaxID=319348 RepID=A0A9J6C778_POLVA|nr:hypothetical protein PVAND_007643 [Polypedilum vanderplanki]
MIKSLLNAVLKFINYWIYRYLLVTELYMTEPWERVTIHVFLFLIFLVQFAFNYSVLLPFTARLFNFQIVT